ncbi:agamous MADS-box protein AGL80 [Trifolium repens]|nr:agamous MADS-box protein AGL80 [Trifolium repens]
MGRASGKVTLKQIQNEKVRKSAFSQRSMGLTKKVSEFSKNFRVETCLIVYDGDGDGKPMTWPQDSKTLQSILTKYEQQKIETTPKEFNVKDYFANKKNMVEVEILRVRKKIMMNKYPTWSLCFNNLGREQLKGFMDIVDLKIQDCNKKINMLKNKQQSDQISLMQNIAQSQMQSVVRENVAAPQSNSNQLDDPMNPLIDISEMIDFTGLIEWDDLMPQKNVFSSNSSQVEVMHSIPQLQYVTAPLKPLDNISLPQVSSTRQFGEFQKLDDLVNKSDQECDAQLVDFNDLAANKLNDGDSWVNPDVFERKDISFLHEIEQECATLDAFHSQPRYGF